MFKNSDVINLIIEKYHVPFQLLFYLFYINYFIDKFAGQRWQQDYVICFRMFPSVLYVFVERAAEGKPIFRW